MTRREKWIVFLLCLAVCLVMWLPNFLTLVQQ